MNYKKLFWGVILVLLGALLILKNTGLICFSWHALWHMWPVLLILWGISMIPVKDYIKLIVSLLILGATITYFSLQPEKLDDGFSCHWNFDDNDDDFNFSDDSSKSSDVQLLQENWDSTTKVAVLDFDAAAGAFKLEGNTTKLIEFNKHGDNGTYSMEVQKKGDSSIINLDLHGKEIDSDFHGNHGGKASVKLNPGPSWVFNFDIGAADLNMDLSKYKVEEINLDGGASSVELKMGNLQKVSKISLKTGASSIKVMIPKESACEIKSNTFLTSHNFDGFKRIGKGTYRSENFNAQSPTIYIDLESAISNLDIERY